MQRKIDAFQGEYRFLSNFWLLPEPLEYSGVIFPTVEHAYQAAKMRYGADLARIARAKTPGDAKRLGRALPMREDWEDVKLDVMEELLRRKFRRGNSLASKLLATGDAELVEGNDWGDRYWGVCRGAGENHLGCLLMKIRAEIVAP